MTSSSIIKHALENLINTSKGQYVRNVIELCMQEHGWTEDECMENIRRAVEEGVVVEKVYSGKDSLRIVEHGDTGDIVVHISDSDTAVATQTDQQSAHNLQQSSYDDHSKGTLQMSLITSRVK